MEILNINPQEILRKQIYTGTVRSVKRKSFKQFLDNDRSDEANLNHYHIIRTNYKNIHNNNNNNYIKNDYLLENPQGNNNKTSILWNTSGWIRVYCGNDRSEVTCDDPSRMIHVMATTTTAEVVKDMDLPAEYSLWIQIGGCKIRRLLSNETPLVIQEEYLNQIGYVSESRRARLGIDPDLKYLIRFHIGPSEIPVCSGIKKSGWIEILKGLVFPQWRRRGVAIVGSQLFVYPGNTNLQPEIFDIRNADIYEHQPSYNRLVLKIIPRLSDNYDLIRNDITADSLSIYNSNCSVSSNNEKVLFFGFEESWERDLWSNWLHEATSDFAEPKRMDIGGSGLQAIPEIVLQSTNIVEELVGGQNKLQEIALKALTEFPHLKILRLPSNNFKKFPKVLLDIKQLTVLDLSDNGIDNIPNEINQLENLEELKIDRNDLIELPNTLLYLRKLKVLHVSQNRLKRLPNFMIDMKTLGLVDMYAQRNDVNRIMHSHEKREKNELKPPLTKVNLRGNHLKGSIILGNYGYLTQLDVSENSIEILDLSALDKLESLQCCRNRLKELTVNGRVLTSLISGNNNLSKLIVSPVPVHLRHLDVGYNALHQLPDWLSGCQQLQTLFANNNLLTTLPDHLFCGENTSLHTLQLGFNKLVALPSMPRRRLPLQQLFLQNNVIEDLPENFFIACENLILLNVSSNKLLSLPIIDGSRSLLEKIYATNNQLTDRILDTLVCLSNLRVIHAAYNRLTSFPESCAANWPELEELVLSGNRLQHLPENLATLQHLKVLRVHSNQLQSVPPLARTTTLKVLDLAHNQLDKINLVMFVPKKLQFLDLSCNTQLQVDPKQLQACRSQRPMSLVDVSGKNRASLPALPLDLYQENTDFEPPWRVGFSETAGNASKLYIAQLRLPGFCNSEGLFGIFDGEMNTTIPSLLIKSVPKILLEERTIKETASDYMKYTLLSAHRELKQQGQKHGVSATLCHISRNKIAPDMVNGQQQSGRRFILRVASVGEATAYLVRHSGNVKLTPSTPRRQIGSSANFPLIIPDPEVSEIPLGENDEFLIIANKKLWEMVGIDVVAAEIRKEQNIILSAKRVQDIAQSYGADENLSIIIVKFNNLGTDVDFLMRELRQTVRKKPNGTTVISGFCKCGCCCETNNSCCHSGASAQFIRQPSGRSDRSSPSGQSDQTANEFQAANAVPLAAKHKIDSSTIGSRRSSNYASNERRSLRGGVVRAVRAKIEEEREREREESDSAMSEEQFKCWEYMLEQNTQLLFDKELNTISRAFTKRPVQTNLTRSQMKTLSSSTPQLTTDTKSVYTHYHPLNGGATVRSAALLTTPQATNVPFLSKHFGSARSFTPAAHGLFKPMRFSSGRVHPISGGPNAAYFGSLQRLMPYNLEYDFAVMQERGACLEDQAELDGRMHQYWGVATTEL